MPSANEWLHSYAERLGVEPPSDEDVNDILGLAGVSAHASERTAAPVSAWLVAKAGKSPAEGLELAKVLADEIQQPD